MAFSSAKNSDINFNLFSQSGTFENEKLKAINNGSSDEIERLYREQNISRNFIIFNYSDYGIDSPFLNSSNRNNSDKVYASIRYYDEKGVLHIKEVTSDQRSDRVLKKVNEEFSQISNTSNGIQESLNVSIQDDVQANFNLPYAHYQSITIKEYGYLFWEILMYRFNINENLFYRAEMKVQFVSGNAAIEEDYDQSYYSHSAQVKAELRAYQDPVTGLKSEEPILLDYWPKNQIQYRIITSGFNLGLTVGRTQSASGGINENGYNINVGSEFSSSYSMGYFYQEQWTQYYPSQNSMILSQNVGSGWDYYNFNDENDIAVTVYPGIFVESMIIPQQYYKNAGVLHVTYKFEVKKKVLFWYVYENISLGYVFDLETE